MTGTRVEFLDQIQLSIQLGVKVSSFGIPLCVHERDIISETAGNQIVESLFTVPG
jgi:hypothetical protein